ncbi:YciI family protein [Roseateles sp. MS654]|uniref:YciI family protein n=1 Tax=Roseateles sp. MS654 TaxID=3412685 RepID=UPI003C309FBB
MQRRSLIAGAAALSAWSPMASMAQSTTSSTNTAAARPADQQWFIFLETGRPLPEDKAAVAAMQRGHLDNFKKLFSEGKLFAAGPMRDPSRAKRGIVVVQAPSREALMAYFQPDEYIREGYMIVNAQPATVRQALNHTGIDPNGIEENRIVLFSRAEAEDKDDVPVFLKRALDDGVISAWYSLEDGPIGEVVFMRGTDETALRKTMAEYPGLTDRRVTMKIWPQWLGKGVLR